MQDETSQDQLERVHRLAEAINQKKRLESADQRSADECVQADEKVQQALEAVRAHKEGAAPSATEKSDDKPLPTAN